MSNTMKKDGKKCLYAAFLLHWIYNYLWVAFLRFLSDPVRLRDISVLSMAGMIAGGFILGLVLPMRDLAKGKRPAVFIPRLFFVSLIFLPDIIGSSLGIGVWYSNPILYVVMAFFANMGTTMIFGFFICLCAKNRIFWICLSFSVGLLFSYLPTGMIRLFPSLPWDKLIYHSTGLLAAAIGIMVFLFLLSLGKENLTAAGGAGIQEERDSAQAKAGRHLPAFYCLVPLAAVFILFCTNSFTDQLFFLSMRLPINDGSYFPVILPILVLPFFGFFADRGWTRFLELSLPVCAALFILTPSLLLFHRDDILFMILYTLLTVTILLISGVFPFIIMDLYKGVDTFYWVWILAISVHLIRLIGVIQTEILKSLTMHIAVAVTLLLISAIVFYILSRKSLSLLKGSLIGSLPAGDLPRNLAADQSIPVLSREESYRAHSLSPRETETAELLLQGFSNDEIKERLLVSLSTIKLYVREIFRKYEVKSRAKFAALFVSSAGDASAMPREISD